ncbi:hypothetical protein [Bradyrhizobium sp. SZCCHNS3002]|uniref:hypothetical protein n=1 Tax=Bradyrhizobium sp. SZCCHNS3002 TaxID=3057310 RepID=UPI0028E3443F|nr:hypothetical protein [Bradyrhizobium sp. SZCCHNS3002]
MSQTPVDIWNLGTFDEPLRQLLKRHEALVRRYLVTDRQLFVEQKASDHAAIQPENPFADAYLTFIETVGHEMKSRTRRVWHYTRLTDDESRRRSRTRRPRLDSRQPAPAAGCPH